MFGSVPLKTYLPDGDIDMAVFQLRGASVRDTWTTRLSAVLEAEARLTRPAFRVKDVQVIHAEVRPRRRAGPAAPGSSARVPARRERYERAERPGTAGRRRARAGLARPARSAWHARARAPACPPLCSPRGVATDPRTRGAPQVKLLKCLVDNIVVDISFDTLNGLCTLAFLEVVDRHVGRAHLFKRSIILARPARGRTLRLAAAPGASAGSRGRPYASRSPLDAFGLLRLGRSLAAASACGRAHGVRPRGVLVCRVPPDA